MFGRRRGRRCILLFGNRVRTDVGLWATRFGGNLRILLITSRLRVAGWRLILGKKRLCTNHAQQNEETQCTDPSSVKRCPAASFSRRLVNHAPSVPLQSIDAALYPWGCVRVAPFLRPFRRPDAIVEISKPRGQ